MDRRTIRVGGLEFQIASDSGNDLWTMLEENRWEPGTVAAIEAVAEGGRLWVDVGAWIGPTVLLAAAAGMRVVAYEPHPLVYARLVENVAANPDLAESITLSNVAVSTMDGRATIATDDPGDTMASLVRGKRATSTSVETVAAAGAFGQLGLDDSAVIKLDIEGAEFAVVPALASLLRRARPTLLLSLHGYHFQEQHRRSVARVLSLCRRLRLLPVLNGYAHWYRLADRAPDGTSPVRELDRRAKARLMVELSGSTILFSHSRIRTFPATGR